MGLLQLLLGHLQLFFRLALLTLEICQLPLQSLKLALLVLDLLLKLLDFRLDLGFFLLQLLQSLLKLLLLLLQFFELLLRLLQLLLFLLDLLLHLLDPLRARLGRESVRHHLVEHVPRQPWRQDAPRDRTAAGRGEAPERLGGKVRQAHARAEHRSRLLQPSVLLLPTGPLHGKIQELRHPLPLEVDGGKPSGEARPGRQDHILQ
mmetsp:Transcript_136398/g.345388  ORF Transcript_136398/g.345388 Transcript_136398/m.345388 type:complete len:205 (-) Transcript_136398:111-725(-)